MDSMKLVTLGSIVVAIASTGCSRPRLDHRGPLQNEMPERVTVAEATVTLGMQSGRLRASALVPAFSVSKSPISVGRYAQCIAAGACEEAKDAQCSFAQSRLFRPTKDLSSRSDLPIMCLAPKQAQAYCAWQGGDLATYAQWMYAARGTDVQQYAWGDTPPRCEQHPGAATWTETRSRCCDSRCDDLDDWLVGKHAIARSPVGMEDVLLAPGELMRTEPGSQFDACAGASGFCVVSGITPAAIDSVRRAPDDGAPGPLSTPYAFRCVWGDK
jgi:hypothetical protein